MHNKNYSIGIITGSGPEAGMDLWKRILDGVRMRLGDRYKGDLQAPEFIIHSLPQLGLSINIKKYEEKIWESLKQSLDLMNGKVNAVCISCNILHFFQSRIECHGYEFEFVSIVDTTINYLLSKYIRKIGFLSIPAIMNFDCMSPYRKMYKYFKIQTPKNFDEVFQIVIHVKKTGIINDSVRSRFEKIIVELGVEDIVIACTELSLIPVSETLQIRTIDTMSLLSEKISNLFVSYKKEAI